MRLEIERRFLVHADQLPPLAVLEAIDVIQAYLRLTPPIIRVRRRTQRDVTEITIDVKGPGTLARQKFGPYAIPPGDFDPLLALAVGTPIEKTLFVIPSGLPTEDSRSWLVHHYYSANAGLVLAEIELRSAEVNLPQPAWVATEVTEDRRFTNAALAERPFTTWPAAERDAIAQRVARSSEDDRGTPGQ